MYKYVTTYWIKKTDKVYLLGYVLQWTEISSLHCHSSLCLEELICIYCVYQFCPKQ